MLDFCCISIGDLTRDCLVFLKDGQVSRRGWLVSEFWALPFRVLGAYFSSLECFVFESWVFCFRDLNALFSNYPYFCSIWLSLKSEIQWLNRLDFSFDHSVLSLLMVNSKGGSLRILILFSDMKSTSEVPVLKSKAIFGTLPSVLENLLF